MLSERAEGFSLIEVLAALAVFSIAAMGLIQLQAQTSQSTRHLEARFLAQVVAENLMVEAASSPVPLLSGTATGEQVQRRRRFEWTRSITPTGRGALMLVEVSVTDPATGQVLARFHTLLEGASG